MAYSLFPFPYPFILAPRVSFFPLFFPLSFRSFSFSLIQLVRQLGPRAVTNRRSSPRSFPHLGYKQGAPTTQQGPFDRNVFHAKSHRV